MDKAVVLIGTNPVGPKCAQRAGLLTLASRRSGLVFPVVRQRADKANEPETLDLFSEEE